MEKVRDKIKQQHMNANFSEQTCLAKIRTFSLDALLPLALAQPQDLL